jgi:hypothetical protein
VSTTVKSGHAPTATTDLVWRQLARASFAVLGQVTPTGEPRSSGVVYTTIGRRLYVVTATDSWKARHIAATGRVAVTVPVRRGGVMALLVPIPPATISFHARAAVLAPDSPEARRILDQLGRMLPVERRDQCRIIEISPEGQFLTYGIGVSLTRMRNPDESKAHVPVA